ncbi:type I pullulanase [Clostridium taeniosporum]|uniref:Type I pullulanase n=1 Tax=Clostridium taeniosporum TaxID=394958 RepID=A0A1D7XNP4_9CLOT|nr:type I pullulanase [Clostridium taeniosporum]AOR24963.2 type I pullulanase [Clostridium taeniosporum]
MMQSILYEHENYCGKLGAIYSKEKTEFILWAPVSKTVKIVLYYKKENKILDMEKKEKGIWSLEIYEDLNGVYYNYIVNNGENEIEVVDPYAKAVNVNGNMGMVIDLQSTNPEGWENDIKPKFISPTDAIIYEMHIRDFSVSETSGVTEKFRGKYDGVYEKGTHIPGTNIPTCLEYIRDLGITHIHLMPIFDYATVDESNPKNYNWGYDPKNFNVPEGSYSLDPFNGEKRIIEFKNMIKTLHEYGIRIVMDVVYNHTHSGYNSNLNCIVPNYYYRQNSDGRFSNGSGCGNELATERNMVKKFIIDSIIYWAKEYHIDGFRFDLMGLYDIEIMKDIRRKLDKIDKSILMYGEGWTGGVSPLPDWDKTIKFNISKFGDMKLAVFSDDIRDGIKGNVFDSNSKGFISGEYNLEETIKFGVVASVKHDQIKYDKLRYSKFPWANEPYQTVTYTSSHDNYTLWDKLCMANRNYLEEDLKSMNKLSAAIVLTSQGIAFFQAGEEFLRTKKNKDGSLNSNSYNAPDYVNALDWSRRIKYKDILDYYKGLIKLRKFCKGFRMNSSNEIRENLRFLEKNINFYNDKIVAFKINLNNLQSKWKEICIIYNANFNSEEIKLDKSSWSVIVNENKAGIEELTYIEGNVLKIPKLSCYVLVKK